MGMIEVDLFSEDVDNEDHPEAAKLKTLLVAAAAEFSSELQNKLRGLSLPSRASAKNPVDFGASGKFTDTDFLLSLGREILHSGEVDSMILHGIGRAGMHSPETESEQLFYEAEIKQVLGFVDMEREMGLPVLIGNHNSIWESRVVSELNKQGVRVYTRIHDIAWLLSAMVQYWQHKNELGSKPF